jgi:excisionase family DNA binding protein
VLKGVVDFGSVHQASTKPVTSGWDAMGMSTHTLTPEDTRPLLCPAEAARLANVSTKTIRREIDRGALPALHAGRQLRIEPADFRRWLESGTG